MNLDRFHQPQRDREGTLAERLRQRDAERRQGDEGQDWPLAAIVTEVAGTLPPPSRVLP